MISTNWPATPQVATAISTNERVMTVITDGTRPSRIFSRRATNGVSRKLSTRASASGMNMLRPRYKAAIANTTAITVNDFEEDETSLSRTILYTEPVQAGCSQPQAMSVVLF